jgi:hypothetical protein
MSGEMNVCVPGSYRAVAQVGGNNPDVVAIRYVRGNTRQNCLAGLTAAQHLDSVRQDVLQTPPFLELDSRTDCVEGFLEQSGAIQFRSARQIMAEQIIRIASIQLWPSWAK